MKQFGKKMAISGLAVCLTGIVGLTGFAATEHWNDNSAKSAISNEWEQWKAKWESIKTDYEKITNLVCKSSPVVGSSKNSKSGEDTHFKISGYDHNSRGRWCECL